MDILQKSQNFQKIYDLVKQKLSLLPKNLFYHGPHHTLEDVFPKTIELAVAEHCSPKQILLLGLAALFHDVGYLEQYDKNEPNGARIADEEIRKIFDIQKQNSDIVKKNDDEDEFVLFEEDIEEIKKIIMATQLPQNPGDDLLCQIICDADLGHLGTDLFFLRGEGLRLELNAVKGFKISPRKWNEDNTKFLKNHKYFTKTAKETLGPKLIENVKASCALLNIPEPTD